MPIPCYSSGTLCQVLDDKQPNNHADELFQPRGPLLTKMLIDKLEVAKC